MNETISKLLFRGSKKQNSNKYLEFCVKLSPVKFCLILWNGDISCFKTWNWSKENTQVKVDTLTESGAALYVEVLDVLICVYWPGQVILKKLDTHSNMKPYFVIGALRHLLSKYLNVFLVFLVYLKCVTSKKIKTKLHTSLQIFLLLCKNIYLFMSGLWEEGPVVTVAVACLINTTEG